MCVQCTRKRYLDAKPDVGMRSEWFSALVLRRICNGLCTVDTISAKFSCTVFFWPDDLMQVINEIGHIKQIIPRYEVY
jgi:hypothetical protein